MQLIMTLLGSDRMDRIADLTQVIRDSQCTVVETRMLEMGLDFAGIILVEGNWNHVARLESAMDTLARKDDLKLHMQRVEDAAPQLPAEEEESDPKAGVPYSVDIVASDDLTHAHELVDFFTLRQIKIIDMNCSRCHAPYGGNPVFLAHLVVRIPPGSRTISLRDEFLEFCDQQHLDAILEPVKR
ncbi:MAG: hypothetical protein RIQ52_931 [Pseudomonadota bacterium]|jgi:glycine cleavage system transcriptional repressor